MKFSNPAQKTTGFASIFDSDSIVIHGKVEVAGSNPAISSREKPVTAMVSWLFLFLALATGFKKYLHGLIFGHLGGKTEGVSLGSWVG